MKRIILIVASVLTQIGLADVPFKVGIYGGQGPEGMGALYMYQWLRRVPGLELSVVTEVDVRTGNLETLELLVMPGGRGTAYDALGAEGRNALLDFIRNGGKFLGTGSSADLMKSSTNAEDKCLGVLPYDCVGRMNDFIALDLTLNTTGREAMGISTSYGKTLRYRGGPWLKRRNNASSDFTTWATYRSEICLDGHADSAMLGAAAIVGGTYGMGKLVVFTHEPQYEFHKLSFLTGAIRWLTGRNLTVSFRTRRRGNVNIGILMDGVPLAQVSSLFDAIDESGRFDIYPLDSEGVHFDFHEHVAALIAPDGFSSNELCEGGIYRSLLVETAATGVKSFVWGTGMGLLPLDNVVTCLDASDALTKILAAYLSHE